MYAGYAVAVGVLGVYGLRLSWRRRRFEKLAARFTSPAGSSSLSGNAGGSAGEGQQ